MTIAVDMGRNATKTNKQNKQIKSDAWHAGRQKRLKRTQYIEREGFHVVEMWECEFNHLCWQNPSLYRKLDIQRPDFFQKHGFKKKVTEK